MTADRIAPRRARPPGRSAGRRRGSPSAPGSRLLLGLLSVLSLAGAAGVPSAGVPAAGVPAPGAPPEPKPPAAPRPRQIEVLHASYGARFDLTPCDVSRVVRAACDHQFSCVVAVRDTLCGAPSLNPPLIATLKVNYRCSDSEPGRQQTADKPFMLRLACGNQGRH